MPVQTRAETRIVLRHGYYVLRLIFRQYFFSAQNVRDSVAVGTNVSKQLRSDDNKNRVYQT